MNSDDLEYQVRRLTDRLAIDDLVLKYALTCDDRDIDGLVECFAERGAFISVASRIEGAQAIGGYYRERFRHYGPTYHVPHRNLVTWADPERPRGVVQAHSEILQLDGGITVAAHRYDDEYVFERGAWRILNRTVQFLYSMPLADLINIRHDQPRRHLPGANPAEADIPEGLATWKQFTADQENRS